MRLIDADELMELYEMRGELKGYEKLLSVPIPVIQQNIKDMLTIDVEPVKHGRWIERPVNVGTCTTGLFCSECNFPSLGWRYNYCPNCGKKMDLEVTNGLDQH